MNLNRLPVLGRFRWAFSGSIGFRRIWVRSRLQPTPHERKPLAILLISLYHAVFSFVLMTLLIRQLPLIQPPRSEAFFPLLSAFFLTAIPAVISLGLWLLGDAARIMAIFLTVIHALGNLLWLLRPNGSWKPFAVGRLVLDFLIIGTLMLSAMRRAFHAPPVKLDLSA